MNPNENVSEEEGKVIAIASGKGGTGKTVSTLNIGMALDNLGKDVLIIDGDLQDPNLALNLGIYSPDKTVNEVIEQEKNILEALYIHDSGLRVIPASLSINYIDSNLKQIQNLIEGVDNYVLIDCGPGLGENVISAIEAADSIVAVTNPMRSSISGTIRLVEMARDLDRDLEGIVVNNITSKEVSLEEIEHITGSQVLGEIPYDTKVDESIVHRKPLVEHRPHSPASVAFKKIAHNLVGKEHNPSFTDRFKRLYGSMKSFFGSE